MSKTLYLECKSGISGDMTVAALLDLGGNQEKLYNALKSLNLTGVSIETTQVRKNGLVATDFDVRLDASHHHDHRHLSDIYEIIDHSTLTIRAKTIAKRIFEIVAKAEAKVHGEAVDHVHFHEVGAWDSIIDIISVAFLIDDLNIHDVYTSALTEGSGFVDCQHGKLPVPVPATAEIAATHDILLTITDTPFEMVTPTGIAIVAGLKNKEGLPPAGKKLDKIGYGAGKRNLEHPNLLRALLFSDNKTKGIETDSVCLLETNIDDSTGEELGLCLEELIANGAKDAHYIPVFTKKNRPAWVLSVITSLELVDLMEEIIFKSTSSIGIRKSIVERSCLKREMINVSLPEGKVIVKKCFFKQNVFYYPEFESVKAVSNACQKPFKMIFAKAKAKAYDDHST